MDKKLTDLATQQATSHMSENTQKNVQNVKKVVDAGSTAVKGAKAVGTGAQAGIAALGNPVTWVIIGIIAAIILFFALIQIMGRNENADGCFDIGSSSSANVESSEDAEKNADNIGAWMTSTNFEFNNNKALSKEQAAAFIGNAWHESDLDPSKGQNGMDVKNKSNEEIKQISGTAKAVGIFQWDGERRTALAEYADEKGKKWNDLDLQLEFFKKEMDESYGKTLASAGFNKEGEKVDKLTDLVNQHYEGSGDWDYGNDPGKKERRDKRVAYAEQFLDDFSGGTYSSSSGGSCRSNSSSVDTSDVSKLAQSLAYPRDSNEDDVAPNDAYGKSNAKQEYKDAKKKAEDETDKDPLGGLYASCDRFVATVIRLTVDPEIPWGSTSEQQAYLSKSPKWERYEKKSEAEPGDIWITKNNGHVILYLGNVDGTDTIAHASYLDRVAGMDPASYLDENLVDSGGRAYYGYRFIGDKPDSK